MRTTLRHNWRAPLGAVLAAAAANAKDRCKPQAQCNKNAAGKPRRVAHITSLLADLQIPAKGHHFPSPAVGCALPLDSRRPK